MNKWIQRLPFAGAFALGIALLAVVVLSEGVRDWALSVLEWFQSMRAWGVLLYVGFYSVIVIFLVPGVIFTFGAGFIFGFWLGALVIATSIAIGSTVAFLVGRYALGPGIAGKLKQQPKLVLLDKGLRQEGWKIVLLSRLVPGFPFKLSNYFFGITSISVRGFFFGNLAGAVPILLINVYIGTLAGELTELIERDRETWEWLFYAVGLVAAIGIVYYVRRIAQRSIRRAVEAEEREEALRANPNEKRDR